MYSNIACLLLPRLLLEIEYAKAPSRREKPLLVCSGIRPESVVLDWSCGPSLRPVLPPALQRGVMLKDVKDRTGLEIVAIDEERLEAAKRDIALFLERYSPAVEPASGRDGFFFVDLTGTERLLGDGAGACRAALAELGKRFSFTAQAGIGPNILVAALAARRAAPFEVLAVPESAAREFVRSFPVSALPGVTDKLARALKENFNVTRVSELAAFSPGDLPSLFGQEGGAALAEAFEAAGRNRLATPRRGRETSFDLWLEDDGRDGKKIKRRFRHGLAALCADLRDRGLLPESFTMRVVFEDDYAIAFKGELPEPVNVEMRLGAYLEKHLDQALARRVRLKKIRIVFPRCARGAPAPYLFPDDDKLRRLIAACDRVRRRYGNGYLSHGTGA